MITSIIESHIKTYAGKYLKNFSSDKISVGLTEVKLTDLEISTEQLWKLRVPFRPIRAYIGEISVDLSFIFGGKLEMNIRDVLFTFEKEQYEEISSPKDIIDSLQAIISVLYFTTEYPFPTNIDNNNNNNNNSPLVDFDSMHRIMDRITINFEHFHCRIEEYYNSVMPAPQGEDLMACGLQIQRLTLRSATTKDFQLYPQHFLTKDNQYNHNYKQQLIINKIIKLEEFIIYCKRDNALLSSIDSIITPSFIRSTMIPNHDPGIIFAAPNHMTVLIAGAYLPDAYLIRPLKWHMIVDEITLQVTDEQLLYLYHLVEYIREYPIRVQSLARLLLNQPVPTATSGLTGGPGSVPGIPRSPLIKHSTAYRARLRWEMIAKNIKTDWWRYSYHLTQGNIRWRTWLEIWVYAAR
jgi:hypothetical protein